ncbi:MAG: flavodoxin [Candidatus Treponema excrementipullorum]|nr:flavodoxin [Candidatus Treponema excrementipullorum]
MKIYIVYWSGTGNTEIMAQAVYEGAKNNGGDVELKTVSDNVIPEDNDVLVFGCPAMGAEELEPDEFEPYFASIEGKLSGKKVGLFGSYDWGDGEWMRSWQSRVEAAGGILLSEGVIAHSAPDEESLEACRKLGKLATM